jgi:glycosyltransferase involved in cell wall biosynthesis
MMQSESLVSIIIPVFNCERYLAEAIESVLAQTYRPLEIIIVDDGSTDGSADVAKGFADPQIRYCYQPNSGQGAARNRGTNLARGSFLAFLDADDVWLTDKLALQIAALEGNPELDAVFGYVSQFHSPELGAHLETETRHSGKSMPGYLPSTMLIKRDSFFRVGPFATNWRIAEWLDWYSKAVEKGLKSLMLPKVVMKRRLHTTNIGIRERRSQTEYVRILKAALDRRREKDTQSEPANTK